MDKKINSAKGPTALVIPHNGFSKANRPGTAIFNPEEDKYFITFTYPPIEKERKILKKDADIWMYLPKSKKILRLASKGSFMQSSADNSDMLRLNLYKDYTVEYSGIEIKGEKECIKLELTAVNRNIAYKKVIYYIDKETKLPVLREFYSISGELIKTMTFEDRKKMNGYIIPTKWIIKSTIKKDAETIISVKNISELDNINDNIFTLTYLKLSY